MLRYENKVNHYPQYSNHLGPDQYFMQPYSEPEVQLRDHSEHSDRLHWQEVGPYHP